MKCVLSLSRLFSDDVMVHRPQWFPLATLFFLPSCLETCSTLVFHFPRVPFFYLLVMGWMVRCGCAMLFVFPLLSCFFFCRRGSSAAPPQTKRRARLSASSGNRDRLADSASAPLCFFFVTGPPRPSLDRDKRWRSNYTKPTSFERRCSSNGMIFGQTRMYFFICSHFFQVEITTR